MLPARSSGPRDAVGLYRVPIAKQAQSGLGQDAQQARLRTFAAAKGWMRCAIETSTWTPHHGRKRALRGPGLNGFPL
jgi:hypothetical protein